jgi:precorrin-6B methylase 1
LVTTIDLGLDGVLEVEPDPCSPRGPGSFGPGDSPGMTTGVIGSPDSVVDVRPMVPVASGCPGCFEIWRSAEDAELGIEGAPEPGAGAVAPAGAAPTTRVLRGAGGSLVVVGLGIRVAGQLTAEARARIVSADRVVYVNDPESSLGDTEMAAAIRAIRSDIPNLERFDDGGAAADTQRAIEARIKQLIGLAQSGENVCIVTYGHPAVCYYLTLEAVRRARHTVGVAAAMLPAVSSLDCLFADLLVDPAAHGLQVFSALAFLTLQQKVDPSISLALLQPALMKNNDRMSLVEKLIEAYSEDHVCYLYRASTSTAESAPVSDEIKISALAGRVIEPGFILFVPATSLPEVDKNRAKRYKRRRPGR